MSQQSCLCGMCLLILPAVKVESFLLLSTVWFSKTSGCSFTILYISAAGNATPLFLLSTVLQARVDKMSI